ncbi:thioredoxin-disulfide reductase [Periweissella beninensis]|uniref:Thioredoxin reductase n=1 Tax=Periweissella beninensis TaxID=504936 RepID=A0ABT0VK65_9LACO|nr:thioredoxin-disulfide reductase [Periweissella beninensis]MBM7544395.1 thioredoxin reductase (NADPH) [Periweissella beninensis]MCM2437839.1 thioredoxin-disulfide reductase [Periweissella beninensis]MCT4396296.1 thioredoxin-disulfide reductase [Periweissella beninensis]
MTDKKYDVIVIGAGPGGMTAALYLSRSNLSVLMLDRGVYGGQMNNTAEIENYPGFESVMGPDLSEKMYKSATQFGAEYAFGTVEKIEDHGQEKTVITDMGSYVTNSVVIATGSQYKKLGVQGEETYGGRGVSYCAVCDGAFFRNKHVVVVGGGDSAVEEGMYLAGLADKVTVLHRRDQLKAQQILQQRAFANPKMEFKWFTEVQEILGDDKKVSGVKVINNQTNESSIIDAQGVFVYVGINPITEPFSNLAITNAGGWIITDNNMATTVPGIFAIGDVRQKELRQVTTAVGDGAIAGQSVYQYLQKLAD